MPALGPTKETPGLDYRYRAWITRDALAEGLAAVARGLDLLELQVGGRQARPGAGAPVRPRLEHARLDPARWSLRGGVGAAAGHAVAARRVTV